MFPKISLDQGHNMVNREFTQQHLKRKAQALGSIGTSGIVTETGHSLKPLALLHPAAQSNVSHLQLID
jgi:hypothetical protein